MAKKPTKKKPPLGSGERFATMVAGFMKEGVSRERAEARAAAIGRENYGAKKMAKLSAAGRKRAAKKRGA